MKLNLSYLYKLSACIAGKSKSKEDITLIVKDDRGKFMQKYVVRNLEEKVYGLSGFSMGSF